MKYFSTSSSTCSGMIMSVVKCCTISYARICIPGAYLRDVWHVCNQKLQLVCPCRLQRGSPIWKPLSCLGFENCWGALLGHAFLPSPQRHQHVNVHEIHHRNYPPHPGSELPAPPGMPVTNYQGMLTFFRFGDPYKQPSNLHYIPLVN